MSEADVKRQLEEAVMSFSKDPLGFIMFAFPWGEGPLAKSDGPDEWTIELCEDIRQALDKDPSNLVPFRSAISSGHGIGKSATVSMLSLWALSTFPETRGLVTANTEDQLRTKTWPELAKWFNMLICKDWFKMSETSIVSVDPEKAKTWRFDRVTWSETNTDAFAGLHNEGKRLFLIFDEASNIAESVWTVAEGALTDRDTEIMWLAFGNPTRNTGAFHRCFHGHRGRWRTRQIDSRNVKITNKAVLAEMVDAYGEDSDVVRVRVRGLFPSMSANQFFSTKSVEEAMRREVKIKATDEIVISCDVARFGSDRTVIMCRRGFDCTYRQPIIYQGRDTVVTASTLKRLADEVGPDRIFIDGGGVGGGVVDMCRSMGMNVVEVLNNHSATNADYFNMGTECWARTREVIDLLRIPDLGELRDDMIGREFKYSNKMQMKLETKDEMKARGLASPDLADALCLLFAFSVAKRSEWRARHEIEGVPFKIDYSNVLSDFNPNHTTV